MRRGSIIVSYAVIWVVLTEGDCEVTIVGASRERAGGLPREVSTQNFKEPVASALSLQRS